MPGPGAMPALVFSREPHAIVNQVTNRGRFFNGLSIIRLADCVSVATCDHQTNVVDAQIEIDDWRAVIEAEAIAFGLIKQPVGAGAEPAVLAEMVLDV